MSILWLLGSCLCAVETLRLPDVDADLTVPEGWIVRAGPGRLLSGPGQGAAAPRLAIVRSAAGVEAAAAGMREGWLRIADGGSIDEDLELPLGGRVWRRIRTRFATGPLVFAQTAWIGTVDGRTIVAVLSSPEEGMPAHQPIANAMLASITLRR